MVRRLSINTCRLLPGIVHYSRFSLSRRVSSYITHCGIRRVPLVVAVVRISSMLPSCLYSSGAMASSTSGSGPVFLVKPDGYNCIVLDLRKKLNNCSDDDFHQTLNNSLKAWKAEGIRAVTMFIPSKLSSRIPTAIQLGFDFHHANPGYVLMLKWLSDTEDNNFPAYANQYLGVGGFVINEHGELLVIKERFSGLEPKWKYPGGGTDPGEHIASTAMREVLEETGISTEFVGILAYRHFHGFRYGCSDIYQACLLRATSTEIKHCQQEILECRWMKLEEFEKLDLYPTSRYIYESYLRYLQTGAIIEAHKVLSHVKGLYHTVYRAGKISPSVLQLKQSKTEPSD